MQLKKDNKNKTNLKCRTQVKKPFFNSLPHSMTILYYVSTEKQWKAFGNALCSRFIFLLVGIASLLTHKGRAPPHKHFLLLQGDE